MKLSDIADNAGARKKRMRVGRGIGSGKGKQSGRGGKGQTARSGVRIKGFEGGQMPIYRRLPKRGFNNIFRVEFAEINLDRLQEAVDAKKIDAGSVVNVEALVKGAYREFRELVPEEGWERWMESITQALHGGEGQILVAEVAGVIQASVQFFPEASRASQGHWPAGVATIRLLAVRPEARGQGLGERLTVECLRRARDLQIPTIYLLTGRFMLAAQHLYEKLGFKRDLEWDAHRQPGPIAYRFDLANE